MIESPQTKAPAAADALVSVIHALEPLAAADRERVFASAQAYFGVNAVPENQTFVQPRGEHAAKHVATGLNDKAGLWIERSGLTMEQIQNVFSIDTDAVEIIVQRLPSAKGATGVADAYVLTGLQAFLRTGDLTFSDTDARTFCRQHGCYNQDHHAGYVASNKNLFIGSKDSGWKLTHPGLNHGVALIKKLTDPND